MRHPFFSINFTNEKSFTLTNVTNDEIRSALRESFPKWGNDVIEKLIANESNYAMPKFYIGSVDEVRKQIAQRGTPLNALLRLVKSYDAYYRNGYRQWGNNGKKVIDMLASEFLTFNNAFKHYKTAVGERQMGNAIAGLVQALNTLALATERKGCSKLKFDRVECVDGRGRRLGIIELAERVPLVVVNITLN